MIDLLLHLPHVTIVLCIPRTLRIRKEIEITCKELIYNRRMRLVIFLQNLIEWFFIITAIKSATFNRSFFILQVTEQKCHELMRIMLHYWMKFSRYSFFEKLYLNYLLSRPKHILIKSIEAIAIAEIIPFSSYGFVFSIFLSKVMIS